MNVKRAIMIVIRLLPYMAVLVLISLSAIMVFLFTIATVQMALAPVAEPVPTVQATLASDVPMQLTYHGTVKFITIETSKEVFAIEYNVEVPGLTYAGRFKTDVIVHEHECGSVITKPTSNGFSILVYKQNHCNLSFIINVSANLDNSKVLSRSILPILNRRAIGLKDIILFEVVDTDEPTVNTTTVKITPDEYGFTLPYGFHKYALILPISFVTILVVGAAADILWERWMRILILIVVMMALLSIIILISLTVNSYRFFIP